MELENKVPEQLDSIKNDNLKALEKLFPSVIKDGELDIDALKEEIGNFEEVKNERYDFTWAGKQEAKKKAQEDVMARTLKFIEKDSVNPDSTENLYIEGDNLEVLKLLRQNYRGAIKMIYIDPPYNTRNDFVYNDNYKISQEESGKNQGYIDKNNQRLQKNSKDSNRFHANWLTMMYPRLKIARDLLSEDGVIFISIDDTEVANLKKICDEIFGEENFIENFCWNKTTTPPSLSLTSRSDIDYILTYQKTSNSKNFNSHKLDVEETDSPVENKDNPLGILLLKKGYVNCKLEDGVYKKEEYGNGKLLDDLIVKDKKNIADFRINSNFKWSQEYLEEEIKNGTSLLIKSKKISLRYLKDTSRKKIMPPNKLIDSKFKVGTNDNAREELKKLGVVFSYPKPTSLIKYILNFMEGKDEIILDFFSGSGTTADAVMQLNAEDGRNRKFIMVQIDEPIKEDTEAYKFLNAINKVTNISEIGKERIRRAGEKIKKEIEEKNKNLKDGEELREVPDIGFKVFRTSDTNINWRKIRDISNSESLPFNEPDRLDFIENYNDKDVVYEVLLHQRDLPLSEKLEVLDTIGNRTYLYASSYLICLETDITENLIKELADLNPLPIKFIFRDSAFKSDINLKESTFRYLKTLVEKNSGINKRTYTIEFI